MRTYHYDHLWARHDLHRQAIYRRLVVRARPVATIAGREYCLDYSVRAASITQARAAIAKTEKGE